MTTRSPVRFPYLQTMMQVLSFVPPEELSRLSLHMVSSSTQQRLLTGHDPSIDALEAGIAETLSETFGYNTPEYLRYVAATNLDTARVSYAAKVPHQEIIEGLKIGKGRALALLKQAIRSFEEKLSDLGDAPAIDTGQRQQTLSSDVFVVHGHDEAVKKEVALVIERAGLNPIILHEQANSGRTIIEKFEHHGGAAGFAVILITPDDVGGPSPSKLRPRARQNVIGELFWFAGKLGRNRVCALRKGEVEMPSDFAGVVYTELDDRGAWKTELLRELSAAGYQVDWQKALL
jgi:predicted nucleotide-binding protein